MTETTLAHRSVPALEFLPGKDFLFTLMALPEVAYTLSGRRVIFNYTSCSTLRRCCILLAMQEDVLSEVQPSEGASSSTSPAQPHTFQLDVGDLQASCCAARLALVLPLQVLRL